MQLEIDEDFPTHPKTLRLCARLQNPTAGFYMFRLWSWARKFQKDGDITAYEPEEIEIAVGWTLDRGKFFAAAVAAGFIDEEKSGDVVVRRTLHNWMKRTGGAIKRMEAEAERKKWSRLHAMRPRKCGGRPAGCPVCTDEAGADSPEDVRRTGGGQSAESPPDGVPMSGVLKTRQDKTRQEREESPPATVPEPDGEIWSAERWLAKFKAAHETKGIQGATAFYGQTSDGKATSTLSVELARLPAPVKLEAQANAAAMFAAFFAGGNDETRKRLWPFSFFVQLFGELRMKAAKPRPPNNPRPPDAGPAIPAAMRPRPTQPEATHVDP